MPKNRGNISRLGTFKGAYGKFLEYLLEIRKVNSKGRDNAFTKIFRPPCNTH